MLAIRRLEPDADRELFEQAFQWDVKAPSWYKEQDAVFRPTLAEFLDQSNGNQADIGIFNGEFCGLVTLTMRAKDIYEAHLWAKRGTSVDLLSEAISNIRDSLFSQMGAKKVVAFVSRKNYSVRRLCQSVGFVESGVSIIRGSYHGRCIVWLEYVLE